MLAQNAEQIADIFWQTFKDRALQICPKITDNRDVMLQQIALPAQNTWNTEILLSVAQTFAAGIKQSEIFFLPQENEIRKENVAVKVFFDSHSLLLEKYYIFQIKWIG